MAKAVGVFQHKLLHLARDQATDVLITVHDAMAYQKTKGALLDASKFVCFPGASPFRQIKLILEKYGEFEKQDIAKVRDVGKTNRFAVCVSTTFPSYVISADVCWVPS